MFVCQIQFVSPHVCLHFCELLVEDAEQGPDGARNRTCLPGSFRFVVAHVIARAHQSDGWCLLSGVWAVHVIACGSSGPMPFVVCTRNRTCAPKRSPQAHVIARVLAWEGRCLWRLQCSLCLSRRGLHLLLVGRRRKVLHTYASYCALLAYYCYCWGPRPAPASAK